MLTPALHKEVVPTTTRLSAGSGGCSKCGTTKKSGKRSCCALGGAWFENCGDVDDTQFDHTWAEGFQACKTFATSVTSPLKDMKRHVGSIAYPSSTEKSRYTTEQKKGNNHGKNVVTGRAGFADCVGLVTQSLCVCVSYIVLCLQT